MTLLEIANIILFGSVYDQAEIVFFDVSEEISRKILYDGLYNILDCFEGVVVELDERER